MSSTGRRISIGAIAKKLAPYFIAAVALGWVLRSTDRHKLMDALHHAPVVAFVAMSAVMLVLNCAADTFAMSAVFGRFGCHVPYRDLYLVRASTYLLAVVNYHVGQAAIVGYLYRVRRVPLLRATGWILFIIGINVGTLFLLASAGATRVTGELRMLRLIPLVCGVGVVVYAALLTLEAAHPGRAAHPAAAVRDGHRRPRLGRAGAAAAYRVLLLWHFVVAAHVRRAGDARRGAALPAGLLRRLVAAGINVNGLGVAQLVAVVLLRALRRRCRPGAAIRAAGRRRR